ncbi:MAG: metallophosphoesterase [Planctomycetota bacterium]|nr:hypothetical protein [Deltaproteobacteria bacterium]MDP6540020.1 metallophosphoesterase [Planctomycetota bacterium]
MGLRARLLANLFFTLALLLGGMQVLLLHWLWVVVLGYEAPPWPLAIGAALALVALNAVLHAPLRRARRAGGSAGVVARAYMSVGVVTLLLGLTVSTLWFLAIPAVLALEVLGIPPELRDGWLRASGNAILAVAAGMIFWGATWGQRRVDETHVRLPLEGLDPRLTGLRIVQLSDLHIGNQMEGARLDQIVARVNAQGPDLIALTGDLFDFDPAHLDEGARSLGALRARYGVLAVLGNHDTYTGSELVAEALARHAPMVRLLRGEVVALPVGAPLHVAGIDDPGRLWTDRNLQVPELEALGPQLPEDGPTILLVHRPDVVRQAARLGFSLVLSGHTHGGQIALPGFAARVNLARVVSNYPSGLFREGSTYLYVNRGAGVAGPAIRIAAGREVTTIELVPA